MKKNIIYFNSKSGFQILGVIWILLGVSWLINNGFKSWLGYGYLLIGIAWLFSSGKRKAVSFKPNQLILHNRQDLFNKKIPYSELISIENRYILFRITTKDGKEYDIDKDQLDEAEIKKFDENIISLNIEINAV